MGTYTTNYNLFMPSIGEQGWGTLVNGNFSTIDTTMKGLNTRIGALETETAAIEGRVTTLETGEFESITAGTITGDISSCFNVVSLESNQINVYPIDAYNATVFSVSGYSKSSATKTYVANPFANLITITCKVWSSSVNNGYRCYAQINGTIVCDTGVILDSSSTKTYTTTLKDGDVIYCWGGYTSGRDYGDSMNASVAISRGTLYLKNV